MIMQSMYNRYVVISVVAQWLRHLRTSAGGWFDSWSLRYFETILAKLHFRPLQTSNVDVRRVPYVRWSRTGQTRRCEEHREKTLVYLSIDDRSPTVPGPTTRQRTYAAWYLSNNIIRNILRYNVNNFWCYRGNYNRPKCRLIPVLVQCIGVWRIEDQQWNWDETLTVDSRQ